MTDQPEYNGHLQELFDAMDIAISRYAVAAAGLTLGDTELHRLSLCLSTRKPDGEYPPNLQQMRADLLEIATQAAKLARAAVIKAASIPEDLAR